MLPLRPARATALLDPLLEQHPVGQAGQRVVERAVGQLALEPAPLGHVAQGHHDAPDGRVVRAGPARTPRPARARRRGAARSSRRRLRPARRRCRPAPGRAAAAAWPRSSASSRSCRTIADDRLVAEDRTGGRARVPDAVVLVDDQDHVGGVLDQRAEVLLALAPVDLVGQRDPLQRQRGLRGEHLDRPLQHGQHLFVGADRQRAEAGRPRATGRAPRAGRTGRRRSGPARWRTRVERAGVAELSRPVAARDLRRLQVEPRRRLDVDRLPRLGDRQHHRVIGARRQHGRDRGVHGGADLGQVGRGHQRVAGVPQPPLAGQRPPVGAGARRPAAPGRAGTRARTGRRSRRRRGPGRRTPRSSARPARPAPTPPAASAAGDPSAPARPPAARSARPSTGAARRRPTSRRARSSRGRPGRRRSSRR